MSKNIRVSSSRIIPGRSILINSNHQSSNMEGKRRNLCTFLFSLSISISIFFSFSQTRHAYTHVHCPRLSTWGRFWPQFDHEFPCSDPFVSNRFSRFHTSGGPWSSASGVRVPLFHQFYFLYHPARRRFLPSPKVDTFYSTRVFFSKVSRFTTIGRVMAREDNDVVL